MYNVMIVDDEPVIKKGLICFVDWNSLDCAVVCEASNGLEAVEKLNTHEVHILISDIRMPGMDGIELSKYVSEKYPDIKIILLTAFADFSYAQQAIKYNVADYVIKTNPSDKLAEAVMKARQLIEQQKEKAEKLLHWKDRVIENLSAAREKFFNDVFGGILYVPEEIEKRINEFGIALDDYFVVSFKINSIAEEDPLSAHHDQRRFLKAIRNFLALALKDYTYDMFMMSKDLLVTVVSFTGMSSSAFLHSLVQTCDEILKMANHFMKFTLNVGISGVHSSSADLRKAYNESLEALMGNLTENERPLVYRSGADDSSAYSPIDTQQYVQELSNSLKSGNGEEAASILKALFQEYKDQNRPMEQFKVAGILIYSLCSRLLESHSPEPSEPIMNNTGTYEQIHGSMSLHGLYQILLRLLETTAAMISSKEKQYSYLIKEVNKYIRDNYRDEIDLQSIADYIHISCGYLCRLFKKETGESIIDALNKFRMETAKRLLLNSPVKIYEVAVSVGFKDQSYFTYVFKKYTGVSPKEYMSRQRAT